jgi:hypothetical protein
MAMDVEVRENSRSTYTFFRRTSDFLLRRPPDVLDSELNERADKGRPGMGL